MLSREVLNEVLNKDGTAYTGVSGMGRYQKMGLLFAIAAGSLLGCKGSPAGAHRWGGSQFGQGSMERQRSRAVTFDPYPLNDIGPPVVGGRPREYANPLPEPVRNELTARPAAPWTGRAR